LNLDEIKERTIGRHSPLRIWAGQAKFRSSQFVANRAVPVYRRVGRIKGPIADRHLFVIAHPRSGSTVLTHVLHGHSDIAGFGEHHVSYKSISDLEQLEARTAYYAREPRLHADYALDKIVWNQHTISPEILAAPTSRFIFLVRTPGETFESYQRMFPNLSTDADRYRSYRRRLDGMVEQANTIDDPQRAFTLTYDELTQNTSDVLERLTGFLELDSPLLSDYELTSKTGSQSWGDPSANIKAGKVLKLEQKGGGIDPEVREPAENLFRSTVRSLTAVTATPSSPALPGTPPEAAHRESPPLD